MPKFKSKEAKEAFCQKMAEVKQWRIDVLSDLVLDVIPTKQEEGIPWRTLARHAYLHYKEDPDAITQGDPMFDNHKDTFIQADKIYGRRSAIRRNIGRRGSRVICDARNSQGRIVGVYLTRSKKAIQQTYRHRHAIIQGSVEHVNLEADIIDQKSGAQIGMLLVQLLLPSEIEID
jgi:hypothetical protein